MNSLSNMYRQLFRFTLNLIFSNDPNKIVKLALPGRYQFVWISEYVGRKVALNLYEKNESKFFENYLKEGNVCLDIGANVGYYTHLFASLVGKEGVVISIEPIPRNAHLIQLNSVINSTDSFVKVFCAAASGCEGVNMEFSQTADSAFSFILANENQARIGSDHIKPGYEKIMSSTITVDTLVELMNLDRIDIVKIDVEGFEYKVLQGMTQLLSNTSRRPQVMMIELQSIHLKYYNSSIKDICQFLRAYGYQAKFLGKDGELYSFDRQHYNIFHNVFFTL